MKKEIAIEVLTHFNEWRRGEIEEIKVTPKEIGISIDIVLGFMNGTIKHCTMCNEEKPIEAYNKNKNNKDGHTPNCRECQKVRNKKWYDENKAKPSYIKKRNQSNKDYYDTYIKKK